jgi:hypothetical protein
MFSLRNVLKKLVHLTPFKLNYPLSLIWRTGPFENVFVKILGRQTDRQNNGRKTDFVKNAFVQILLDLQAEPGKTN